MTLSSDEKDRAEKPSFFANYISRLKAFTRNARLYLLGSMTFGAVMGIFNLLYNFYVLSLGYDESALGTLVTVRSVTTLVMAIPLGFLINRIGKKNAFILGSLSMVISLAVMILFPLLPVFYVTSVFHGLSLSLTAVAMGPFLMENSSEYERTYLFSFASGMGMTASSIGQWIGGYLPTWFGELQNVSPTDTKAYAAALLLTCIGALLSTVPYFLIKNIRVLSVGRSVFTVNYFRQNPKGITRLILPLLITSVGAGMIMPFMNVFYRVVHHQSDAAIGTYFAWSSLAMGLGLLSAPALSERIGKIRVVVLSQTLSIPFLIIVGYAPYFPIVLIAYYVRTCLMNMSSPVYSTYMMEQVPDESRAMIASLSSMANNFGWAFSPIISGWLQMKAGFNGPFLITIIFYMISTFMYYFWHWRKKGSKPAEKQQVTVQH